MLDMSVPRHLWGHAVLYAAYLINRTPSQVLDFKTPHDVFLTMFHLSQSPSCLLKFFGVLPMFMSTLINIVNLILVLCDVSLLVTRLLRKVISAIIHLPRRCMGSELESLGLENDVFEDAVLGKETTCRTEASDRLPISEDETCGPCEETTDCPLELGQLPISGDEVGALSVETIGHTEASDQSPVSENNDSDSCMDEFDAIPPSALPVPQSTRDSESNEVISNDLSVSTY
ncbi:unnamed protein product, partial [Prunus brigantina]